MRPYQAYLALTVWWKLSLKGTLLVLSVLPFLMIGSYFLMSKPHLKVEHGRSWITVPSFADGSSRKAARPYGYQRAGTTASTTTGGAIDERNGSLGGIPDEYLPPKTTSMTAAAAEEEAQPRQEHALTITLSAGSSSIASSAGALYHAREHPVHTSGRRKESWDTKQHLNGDDQEGGDEDIAVDNLDVQDSRDNNNNSNSNHNHNHNHHDDDDDDDCKLAPEKMTVRERIALIRPLVLPYMLPLFFVFWAEYTINQGISPVLLFPLEGTPFGSLRDHYIYYQCLYQLGVFVSRSSVEWFPIRQVWAPSVLQVVTMLLVLMQALYSYIPSVWILFLVIFWEGLLGGATYVNAFYNIARNVDPAYREFSMGVTAVADTLGITVAGLTSFALTPALCAWQVETGTDLCRNR